MSEIVSNYSGQFTSGSSTVAFTAPASLDKIIIDGHDHMLNSNCGRYGRIKFRNHIMEHIHSIMMNENYKLRPRKFISSIYHMFTIHDSWKSTELIYTDETFILQHFDSTVHKTFTTLDKLYKKKYYLFCYLYIYGGFYVGNSCLKLNYPLEYFIKKRSVLVYNSLTNNIYDDFFYVEPGNRFLKRLIELISHSLSSTSNESYDNVMGEPIFTQAYEETREDESTQLLTLSSYIKTDLPQECNYVWINEKKNHERYIDMKVSKYLKIEAYHAKMWLSK